MISSKPAVNIVPTAGGFLFAEDGQDVLFYQRETKRFNAAHSRSHYVHPLYGLDGELLTEEFPSDHPHHCGIFWAWQYEKTDRLVAPWLSHMIVDAGIFSLGYLIVHPILA